MSVLEDYEWTNIWWDKPSNKEKRILLVGDSITNGYREFAKRVKGDAVYIDMYATSRAIDNKCFLKELFYILNDNELEYNIIHFNNGLHGFHLTVESYKEHYEYTVNKLIETKPNAKIILANSTPITVLGDVNKLDEKNQIVIERNRVVSEIAQKYNLQLNDLYNLVVDNTLIRVDDGFHYNAEGYKCLGNYVANLIL
jgi:lysophospholipase L1-like esterase